MSFAFSEAEHRDRIALARAALRAAQLDAMICVAPEHLYYFGGYEAHTHFSSQALVFTAGDDEPTLVIRDLDLPLATESSWLTDIRLYRFGADDPAGMVAAVVREKGTAGGRIGLDLQSYALPGAYAFALVEALRPAEVVDATDTVGAVRLVKSDQELAYLREAGRIADLGLRAAQERLRAGITENAYAGEIDAAMRAEGGEYTAMPTWVASGPRTAAVHGTPTNRVLERGDLVHVEIAGASRRYHSLAMQTLALGEPAARMRAVVEAALEGLHDGATACKVGVPVAAVEESCVAALRRHGVDQHFMGRFGYGISAAYPPSWLEPLHIIRESPQLLERGMVFVLHTNVNPIDEGFGVLVGGTYALGDDGVQVLSGGELPLFIA
jgi:Xaa-Pro dipeptidase